MDESFGTHWVRDLADHVILNTGSLLDLRARQAGSARIRRELRRLDSELLHRWPDNSAARDFHDALIAV
ncbi:hypothetical protein OIE66_07095 [Nonomuraea sp. NBC_01738]|uniref:hypothetical protein n=1 Tax=Nonomuraea sp. NBC_01738 TaxID=2976003 RepID=UPI002E126EBC|nr:hypothetical protein OIE66_07095 [Nonomuraea sp. NBC_01738]